MVSLGIFALHNVKPKDYEKDFLPVAIHRSVSNLIMQ